MRLKAWTHEAENKELSIRCSPIGKDRQHNKYWFFEREERLFVQLADSNEWGYKEWGYYNTKEEVTVMLLLEISMLTNCGCYGSNIFRF